jgi:hypothetical protein
LAECIPFYLKRGESTKNIVHRRKNAGNIAFHAGNTGLNGRQPPVGEGGKKFPGRNLLNFPKKRDFFLEIC